jgi:T5SS/PEP-CTERM-associated repeat protein
LDVIGAGSQLTCDSTIAVGTDRGSGTMAIAAGGHVSDLSASVGESIFNSSPGAVTVDGAGSAWMNQDHLDISGSLDVTNGGSVSASTVGVGVGGTLTVTSGGSVTASSIAINGGVVRGNGSLSTTGGVHNSGYLFAGVPSRGSLAVTGDLVESSSGADLGIPIAGSSANQIGKLDVTGALQLNGVLEVVLFDGFMPVAGQSFDILDWGTLSGQFTSFSFSSLPPSLSWDTRQLYTTGVIRVRLTGDYDDSGVVDASDYILWRKTLGSTINLAADGNGNGVVDQGDYDVWRAHFAGTGAGTASDLTSALTTAVPEPGSELLLFSSAALAMWNRRKRVAPVNWEISGR